MKDFSVANLKQDLIQALPAGHGYSEQIGRALSLACRAHDGQYREQRDRQARRIPYITHPVGVAKLAMSYWLDGQLPDNFDDVISAALMHDVLEDSQIDFAELVRQTSERAAGIVLALTKPLLASNLPRDARNAAFVEQIVSAGATARYLKLCDAIHNLSRPDLTPLGLLEKSIRKVRRDYAPLATGQPFSATLERALSETLGMAEDELASQPPRDGIVDYSNFERVLAHFSSRTRGKVLEEHDIQELVSQVPGVVVCLVTGLRQFEAENLVSGRSAGEVRDKEVRMSGGVEHGELALQSLDLLKTAAPTADYVLMAPLEVSQQGDAQRFIFAAVDDDARPGWLTANTFRAAVGVLAERLRSRASHELAEYGETLSHFRLNLDPVAAKRLHLSQLQMKALQDQQEAASFVHHVLGEALRLMLRRSGIGSLVDGIQSRVKAPGSIIAKLSRRKTMDVNTIDDLVGFRVVFVSGRARDQFLASLLNDISDPASEIRRAVNLDPESVTRRTSTSDAGYHAKHVWVDVEAPLLQSGRVRCEIQLRTVLEDAWARISQLVAYKKDFNGKRREALLLELARLRDEADRRISDDLG